MSTLSTPLRYPGGKQKIAPFITEILQLNNISDSNYIEPYAGGAGIAINLLLNKKVKSIHLNDKCIPIYSFWKTLIKEPEWLCKKIILSSLNIEEWKKQREIIKNLNKYSIEEIGFAAFYLNRCNRSGILNGGIIGGLNQDGIWKMDARFEKKSLINRIEAIANESSAIKVTKYDAELLIAKLANDKKNSFIYYDPPYLSKGEKLYLNHYTREDHNRISKLIQKIKGKYWIVSYDNNDYITDLYKERRKFVYYLQYNASKVYLGQELFIFSDNLIIPQKSSNPQINFGLKQMKIQGGSQCPTPQ
jgi:DNA adenine methylase